MKHIGHSCLIVGSFVIETPFQSGNVKGLLTTNGDIIGGEEHLQNDDNA